MLKIRNCNRKPYVCLNANFSGAIPTKISAKEKDLFLDLYRVEEYCCNLGRFTLCEGVTSFTDCVIHHKNSQEEKPKKKLNLFTQNLGNFLCGLCDCKDPSFYLK